ncbi:UDP-glucose 4-epimerase GalE [bacterium]|nr:UDP-glucose 4-epimerase GalE [bacterium]
MSETILITGGGGYIGSHAVRLFLEKGYRVVVFDNFQHGFRQVLEQLAPLGELQVVEGDLRQPEDLEKLFTEHKIEGVLHFAALCSVNESTQKPELYLQNNVVGSINLLETMLKHNVRKIIFSSTSAVYNGMTAVMPINESTVPDPLNSYGESKYMIEKAIKLVAQAHEWKYVIFRYFNVCGASSDGLIGDSKHPSVHLMQNAVRGAMGLEPFYYTFQQMPTPDGSPIRDYVDVEDLVRAHFLAYEYLKNGGQSDIFNLGNGRGYSVLEIVRAVEQEFGVTFPKQEAAEKREGENAQAYVDPTKVEKVLGWKMSKTLQQSIQSLKLWYSKRPQGWEY